MTDPFEARLQRALDHAARQLEVPMIPWRDPARSGRRRPRLERLGLLAGAAVAVIVVVLAVALIGHRHPVSSAAAPNPLAHAPAAAFQPPLTPPELNLILAAYRRVAAGDRDCQGLSGPELAHGTPSSQVRSLFSTLRGPPTTDGRLRRVLENERGPALIPGTEFYVNQIHRARSAFGGTFYLIPAGNITGQRGVPARCQAEQVTALKARLARAKASVRARVLAAQRRYLAYMRYLALHPEGVCAAWLGPGVGNAANLMCGAMANFERWGIMADASSALNGTPVFWTVVPDVVSTVTLRFVPGGTPLRHPVTITVRPLGNVAVAVVPHGRSGSRGSWADQFPATIVLRDRAGHLVRRTTVTPNMPTLCGFGC
jgi:hypothetical protein